VDACGIASLPSSASALEIAQTARQTFCHLASTHSTMGKLTTLNCGATTYGGWLNFSKNWI